MSDLNANAHPKIPVIRIVMTHQRYSPMMVCSAVRFTGLIIKPRADSHLNLLRRNAIFAKYTTNDTLIQESTMIKEAASTCWKLTQNIQISTEIPSFKLSILSRYPGRNDHILAQVELQTARLISVFLTRDLNRGSEVFTQLDNNDSVLKLGMGVVVVPSRPSSNPSSADGNSWFDLPTTNGQSGLDPPFKIVIDFLALLSYRGKQFLGRFKQFGNEDDLQKAISDLNRSVSLTSDSSPYKPHGLDALGIAFTLRFQFLGDGQDLDQAIKLGRDAVTLADGYRDDRLPHLAVNLSNSYACRSEFLGSLDDLNSAVSAAELAVSVSAEGGWSKARSLFALASCLDKRFERLGELNDIESAIEMGQLAFSSAPEGSEGGELKYQALVNTANSLLRRSHRLGKSDDVEEAISEMKRAIDSMSQSSPHRFVVLDGLSDCLKSRFALFDDPADLDDAIVKGTDAINAMPRRSPTRPAILGNLSGCFYGRFTLNRDLNDLNESISLLKSAISDAPDGHDFKPELLKGLGARLHDRFSQTKDANDIDEAVSVGRRAVACTPDGHPEKPSRLRSLMVSLLARFQVNKRVDDLEESITGGRNALSLIPEDHPDKIELLSQLGDSVACRFEAFQNPSDADEATSLCKSATLSSTSPPSKRLNAAISWTKLRMEVDFPSALEASKIALDLLPRVAWTGKSIAARHRTLARLGSLVNVVAACTIQLGHTDTALEWLEMGRAIVWGQLHNLRSPVDLLSDAHPHLAERLSQVAGALEKATSRDVNLEHFKGLTMEEIAREHRRLATEWDSLVERVRALPGFEDFLGPKKLATLKNTAKLGLVVLLNVTSGWCDALILIPALDDVVHIPLKDFSLQKAKILQEQLNKSLSAFGVRTRASQPVYATTLDNVFMNVLKELWTCIVKPVLYVLAFSPCDSTNPPRLWWCPTHALAFLPIHAAGDYHTNERGTKLSDYDVSSYTLTLTILLEKIDKTRTFKGLLVISQPNTPGMSNLPGTKEEVDKIKERASTEVLVKSLRGKEATPDTLLHGMSTCNWVHMAWHATQEKANPLDSTFHLHPSPNYPEGNLLLSQLIAKSFPDADFAYLSACQTAAGDESLTEESVHLAAGMLMAGYRSVVATLWSIRDVDAPLIADEVYSRLFEDREPDSGKAAIALHHAVQSLRRRVENEPGSFVRWVPFIHVGV
ncbi:CHAT domain-containing protein [Armillaria fumosa]|nr:CHAT domain-containing protein [Armillaria fumosa]